MSPHATTRLKRQAQDSAVRACPVGSFIPVLRTVISSSRWKRDSVGGQGIAFAKIRSKMKRKECKTKPEYHRSWSCLKLVSNGTIMTRSGIINTI